MSSKITSCEASILSLEELNVCYDLFESSRRCIIKSLSNRMHISHFVTKLKPIVHICSFETKTSEVNVILGCIRVFFLVADMYQS